MTKTKEVVFGICFMIELIFIVFIVIGFIYLGYKFLSVIITNLIK
jgi:t-SNARE complex subunit (syntaxin)